MTIYQIAMDKNGDGYVAWDIQPGDALNLVRDPVQMADLPLSFSNALISLNWEETPYGVRVINNLFQSGAASINMGRDLVGADAIPVTAGKTYTAALWIRGSISYTGISTFVRVYNQADTLRASLSIEIVDSWTRFSLSFTAQPGDTFVYITVEKPVTTPPLLFDITGIMVVEGTSLPAAFNSGDPLDFTDDITVDVLSMRWRLGMAGVFDVVAAPTEGQIIMDDNDGRYSPEQGQIRLEPRTRVKARVTHSGQTYHLFSGWIMRVVPQTGDLSARTTVLHLAGPEHDLANTRILVDLLLNISPDNLLDIIFTRNPLERIDTGFNTSPTHFAFAGDTWEDGITAELAIRQILEAERGRFYSDRANVVRFLERGHLANRTLSPVVLQDSFEALDYVYGEGLVNEARIRVKPRALGTVASPVWTLNYAQAIPPSPDCREVAARFRDSSGNPIGATGLITPVPFTDYTANTKADGSGSDVTGQVTITFLPDGSGSAVVMQICNSGAATVYLQPGSQIRGLPLIQGDPMLVQRRDQASVDAYGLHSAILNLPYFVTAEEAEGIADQLLLDRKRPFGVARALTLSNRVGFTSALALSLFDAVTVRETRTGHDAIYFIIAEEHTLEQGGARHTTRWLLEPVNPGGLWKLNQSELDTSTRLGMA